MSLTNSGGRPNVGPIPYSAPQGPTTQSHNGPGLGGDSYGNGQQPVCHDREAGSSGIGGTNHGNSGSQN